MDCLAIIPARGGSKGILRKNLHPVAGLPMVAWSIQAAFLSKHISRVVVSTDDKEIADVSEAFGAIALMRPPELSTDTASSEAALLNVLAQLKEKENYQPDIVVFLQCTSPLTSSLDIDGAIEKLLSEKADSCFSVTQFSHFIWDLDENGNAKGINHDKKIRAMRQQVSPQYLETGAIYIFKTPGFLEHKHRFFGKTVVFEVPEERCLEIDTYEELQRADVKLRAREQAFAFDKLPLAIDAVVFDFDGVFTDNRVIVSEHGEESALCSRRDGFGIESLKKLGIPLLVLSREDRPIVKHRCQKLGIECLHGVKDKFPVLQAWAHEKSISLEHTIFVGDDVADIECLTMVGCGVVVKDAHPEAIDVAKIVLSNNGGAGAVRELCDLVIERIETVSEVIS